VDEMSYLLQQGFREIHIVDDGFSTRTERVISICEEIIRRKLSFPWYPNGGIRADCTTPEMLRFMKRAGCYKVPFGVESGSQRILDIVGKRLQLPQIEQAVRWAGEAGLETECNFMLGLPTETEEDAARSFEFAKKLRADYVKFAITIPLPGTRLFALLESEGRLLSRDWDLFQYDSDPGQLYRHDRMPAATIFRARWVHGLPLDLIKVIKNINQSGGKIKIRGLSFGAFSVRSVKGDFLPREPFLRVEIIVTAGK